MGSFSQLLSLRARIFSSTAFYGIENDPTSAPVGCMQSQKEPAKLRPAHDRPAILPLRIRSTGKVRVTISASLAVFVLATIAGCGGGASPVPSVPPVTGTPGTSSNGTAGSSTNSGSSPSTGGSGSQGATPSSGSSGTPSNGNQGAPAPPPSSSPVNSATPPPQATVISNIQTASGNWMMQGQLPPLYVGCTTNCVGVNFSMQYGITSPSLSNNATQFNLGGSAPYGDALFAAQLIGQNSPQMPDADHQLLPTLHHFIYDTSFYIATPSATPVLEFDIAMFMNGMGLVWDTQCSHRDGQWDTWSTVSNSWVPAGIPCESVAGWNHVTIQMERESDNSLLFQSITLNGTTYPLQITYPAGTAPSNWWGLTANYQMDGNSPQVSSSTYLDNFNVTYW